MYAVATGDGLPFPGSSLVDRTGCAEGTFGWPCFRSTALPVVVMITDVRWHNGPGNSDPYTGISGEPSYADAVDATIENNIRFVGIGQGSGGMANMRQFATDVGTLDADGDPLVRQFSGDIEATFLSLLEDMIEGLTFEATAWFADTPDDGVDATVFIADLVPVAEADEALGCSARDVIEIDGVPVAWEGIIFADRICLDIALEGNDTVEPTEGDIGVYSITVGVVGEGGIELNGGTVVNFVVPPAVPTFD